MALTQLNECMFFSLGLSENVVKSKAQTLPMIAVEEGTAGDFYQDNQRKGGSKAEGSCESALNYPVGQPLEVSKFNIHSSLIL